MFQVVLTLENKTKTQFGERLAAAQSLPHPPHITRYLSAANNDKLLFPLNIFPVIKI